ncbi:MAG: EAL domain-containing protein [Pseudomonadota bacterium]
MVTADKTQAPCNSDQDRLPLSFELLREMVQSSDLGLCLLDAELRVVAWNAWLAKASGMEQSEVVGRKIDQLYPHLSDSRFLSVVNAALIEGIPGVLPQKLHNHFLPLYKNRTATQVGEPLYHTLKVKPVVVESQYCLVQVFDVSSSVYLDQNLREQTAFYLKGESRSREMLSSILEAVISCDKEGRVEFSNLAAEQLTGYGGSQVLGKPLVEVYQVFEDLQTDAPDIEKHYMTYSEIVASKSSQLVLRHREGLFFPVEQSIASLRDEQGQAEGVVLVFRDVSKSRKLAAQLRWQAGHDALTGLFNRNEFDRQLATLLDESALNGTEHSLLYLDLDRFKVVNDSCGHVAGDELLRQITGVIKREIRSNDTLARLGGDEFGILLSRCPVDVAVRLANSIREAVQDYRFGWEDQIFSLGVSIGLVAINVESEGVEQILSLADTACYAAKDAGRNRVHIYYPDEDEILLRRGEVQWVAKIRHALDEDRFTLYVQPIRAAAEADRNEEFLEILVRMLGRDGQIIMPGAFIPAAERYDLMPAIDRWVVTHVIRLINQHSARFRTLETRFFINLSGQTLSDERTLQFILEKIDECELGGELLCFEVTETAAISNLSSAEHFIRALQRVGCEFALDDFGSGLSSFGYLRQLPVNYLKIDGSFVKDMVNDPIDHSMVEAINNIGHILGLMTVAEFVENAEILQSLRSIGVDYVQGYGIQAPMPMADLLALLEPIESR